MAVAYTNMHVNLDQPASNEGPLNLALVWRQQTHKFRMRHMRHMYRGSPRGQLPWPPFIDVAYVLVLCSARTCTRIEGIAEPFATD